MLLKRPRNRKFVIDLLVSWVVAFNLTADKLSRWIVRPHDILLLLVACSPFGSRRNCFWEEGKKPRRIVIMGIFGLWNREINAVDLCTKCTAEIMVLESVAHRIRTENNWFWHVSRTAWCYTYLKLAPCSSNTLPTYDNLAMRSISIRDN